MEGYFSVTVHGEYFAQVGDKRELRGYEGTFKLPNADKPLSTVVGKLLVPFLQQKDPQCLAVYTHYVDLIECKGRKLGPNEIPIRFQSKEQLKEYVAFHQLPVNVNSYGNIGKLRDHVRIAKEEPEIFAKVAETYEAKRADENKLFALNKDILVTAKKPVPTHDGGRPMTKTTTVQTPISEPELTSKPELEPTSELPSTESTMPDAPALNKKPVKKKVKKTKTVPQQSKEAEELLS